jgi:hypothetical protein
MFAQRSSDGIEEADRVGTVGGLHRTAIAPTWIVQGRAGQAHNDLIEGSSPPGPTTQSFEPEDFPETAEKPAIGGLLRLRFSLRGDRFWP